jgi:hypothetical protein
LVAKKVKLIMKTQRDNFNTISDYFINNTVLNVYPPRMTGLKDPNKILRLDYESY